MMKKRAKVLKHVEEEAKTFKMYCRLDFHNSLSLFSQTGVRIIPKPDKTMYSSTISVLNKVVRNPTNVPALGIFLGTQESMTTVAGITPQMPGKMHMFVNKLKASLNHSQVN